MASQVKGRGTIRTAAVLFLASAVFEILDIGSAVVLFGGVRIGAPAVLYHIMFAGLYALSGIGLWQASRWGYRAFMTTTAVYTVDKLQLMVFPQAFYEYVIQQLTVTREIVGMIPREQLLRYFMLAYGFLVVCWWGFALYIHMRRRYFQQKSAQEYDVV